MKRYTTREITELIYKVETLLLDFDSIPDDGWHDLVDWGQLDELAGYRNHFAHHFKIIPSDAIEVHCRLMEQKYNDLALQLRHLKLNAPEYFEGKSVVVTPEPADVIGDTCDPTVIISDSKKKKISAKKVIIFCGYLFPKKFREEAKGDIFETRHEMFENGSSKIAVNFVTVFKIFSLILGSLRIRLSDLVKTENEMNK